MEIKNIPEAQTENITYETGRPSDFSIIRRVTPEDYKDMVSRMIRDHVSRDLISTDEDMLNILRPVKADIESIQKAISESIVWGIFSGSGILKKLFEKTCPRRLITPEDAKAFKELYLTGLQDEPEKFGSTYEEIENKSIEEVTEYLQNNYISGVSHGRGYRIPPEPEIHRLIGMGAVERGTGLKSHIAVGGKLYVRKGHRLTGIGEDIVRDIFDHINEMEGVTQVNCIVTHTNKHVIKWYQDMGFTAGERMPNQAVVRGVQYDWVPMYADVREIKFKK